MPEHGPVGDFAVNGKIVLVTGGGSGIGLALVQLCLEAGARVIIGDLKLTAEAKKFVDSEDKSKVFFKTCDVTSWKSLQDVISASKKAFGDVPDIYAPVAGVLDPSWSNFWDDNEDEFYKTVQCVY